jgi:putative intracellular protease/amidase
MIKVAYLYVFDTMADWEGGYAIAELNSGRYFKNGSMKYTVKTISNSMEPIVTMGGMRVIPDTTVNEFKLDDAGLLILPGGNTWLETIHDQILEKAKECLHHDITVAAICGATFGLARAGLLNDRYHTSNDLDYLMSVCPNYAGSAFYRPEPAVSDRKLITAPGVAPIEFAYQILKSLDVISPQALEAWYQLNRTHEARYFFELMVSLK